MDWLYNNTEVLGLGEYGGVVGVDHYWTHQGMPCVNGKPQEFVHQDALAQKWKAKFPTMKMLQYRILSAVNYDMVIQEKITSDRRTWRPRLFFGTCSSCCPAPPNSSPGRTTRWACHPRCDSC